MRRSTLSRSLAILSAFACALTSARACAQSALTPSQALDRFKVAPGFEVELFAAEPMVRQPVTMTFDDRGRLWVIQYLQYPAPAGLTPVQVDQYLRTKYDRVPEPPPRGPTGADRITILEDTDGDGRADKAKDFVTGLNLASALAIGHGGVFVGQAPYLLFYPDRDGDDVPDGDPEVLLKGFGLEDAHAVVNSMQWGPDGWLYGAQGSTVTANIKGVEFQQGIWRYHPVTHKFELFSEGGGNTWGLDFDRHGNTIAGTNWGDKVLLHQVQGGYYIKGFTKHGPLHNPFTYGYFDHAPHEGWRGGHVTCGGIVYRGDSFPSQMRDKYIAANLLSNAVYWHDILPTGSTFRTRHAGELLTTDDVWFRPIDCLTGPDGSVYVADWYDVRANHVIPEDTWDKSNGRVWRIKAAGVKPVAVDPLSQRTTAELIHLLDHKNDWYAREALRILYERHDSAATAALREALVDSADEGRSLHALWALNACGGFDDQTALRLMGHSAADVRAWTVRLLGDRCEATSSIAAALIALAAGETNVTVRCQLACSAKRLPAGAALPIVAELLRHEEDANDPFMPLLLWWAIEDKATAARSEVIELVLGGDARQKTLVDKAVVERLIRRYTAENTDAGYESCARLLAGTADRAQSVRLIAAMEQEMSGKRLAQVPPALADIASRLWKEAGEQPAILRWSVRIGSPDAYQRALDWAADASQPQERRTNVLSLLGQIGDQRARDVFLEILRSDQPENIRLSALAGLERFDDTGVTRRLLERLPAFSAALRGRAIDLLCARQTSSAALIGKIERGDLDPQLVSIDQLRRIVGHSDPSLTAAVEKRWGKIRPATAGEKQAMIVVLNRTLSEGSGDAARGKAVFTKHCANCHTLHGEGAKIGPDLTSVDRRNRSLLLLNIVDPSSTIRPEYVSQTLLFEDGRVTTGLVAESGGELTIFDAKAQKTVVPRSDVEQIKPAELSLMPEKLLEGLTAGELRDLFAFLQSSEPMTAAARK
jgi:putative membrane-bound dehydrogenase-like protein